MSRLLGLLASLHLAFGSLLVAGGAEPTKLLRFPDLHKDTVVFTYGGDLWSAPTEGGVARRLTSHPGLELFARFSPDGNWIAFTGQYEGDEQVYVMPAAGGPPRQLTFYPARGPLPDRWGLDNQVYGWTPDSKQVMFRSMRYGWGVTENRLFLVPREGGLAEPLPMPSSGAGDLEPDGNRVVYSPRFRDFRTWKRYEGGWAQDLFLFDRDSLASEQITDHPRTDRDPMWIGDTIFFSSDRAGKLNLYSYDLASKAVRQRTHHDNFDVRWPSKGPGRKIIYELGGELYVFDASTDQSRKLEITVPTDALPLRPRRESVGDRIESFGLSPQGQRALFVARGDIFTAPIEDGPVRNLTHSSSAHDKWAAWSPDGSRIAYLSDASGEEELYVIDERGREEPHQLTQDGTMMRYRPVWSPDNRHLAFSDKEGRVFIVDTDGGKPRQVADDPRGTAQDYVWSPGGEYLALTLTDNKDFRSIYIWSQEDEQLRRITSRVFNEFNPAWDPAGEYLFYLSDRQFAPQIGSFEWNYVVDRETGIFAVALRNDTDHLFPPKSDEAEVKNDDDGSDEANPPTPDDQGDSRLKIDFDGIESRVLRVPVDADNLSDLSTSGSHLLYIRRGPFYYGRSADVKPELHIYSIKDRKGAVLAEAVAGYALSEDGQYALARVKGQFQRIEIKLDGKSTAKEVATSNLQTTIDPRQEWRQIFHEVWRRYRDFFYVENMHGYDWKKLREQYEPLLDHVSHRTDLNYVIGEMIAELNVGHAYNAGGDFAQPDRPKVALLGAHFELDAEHQLYRFSKIYEGHNEEPDYRAPLREVGTQVEEGEFLLSIDGVPVGAEDNIYQHLRGKADQMIELEIAPIDDEGSPLEEQARLVQMNPISDESNLSYLEWTATNRRRVTEATKGRVGYLHLPDMGEKGIREFIKWYYGQLDRDGLIIDVRKNGGGNVSQMVLNRLQRELLATGFARNRDAATTYPDTVFHGHLVCVLDENSGSDGDIFPAMFRRAKLGPLIGKRSWGGVIGITNRGTLIDGGSVFVPEFGFASDDGHWIIEGYGVDPDIEVDNPPDAVIAGKDPQLERAIKEVLRKIRTEPKRLPNRPPPPVKTPDAE